MRTLLVATDFSPVALNATNYALELAQAMNASVTLFHVYQIPISFSEVPVPLVTAEELEKAASIRLKELKTELEKITDGKVKIYAEAVLGDVSDELDQICSKLNPVAVVMGSKGQSAVERLFLGSNALTAIRHLKCPVLIIPPGAQFKGIQKVGFACDLRQVVETTPVPVIKEWVNSFNAELHVLNVDHNNKHFTPETPEQSLLLHTMLEDLAPKYHFIDNPKVEDGVHNFAETHNMDLLVVIPKKHKLLEAIFQRSHSKDMIFHAHIPMLAIHE